jgi:hypothetical protein
MKSKMMMAAPLLLLALTGCTHQEAFRDAKREIASQDEVMRELRTRNEELMARDRALSADLDAARAEADALRTGRQDLDKDLGAP